MKEQITKILNDKLINSGVLGREVIFEHEIEDIVNDILLVLETKWISPIEKKPIETRSVIFKLKGNDIRIGIFLVKDQFNRENMFCDGSFHKLETVIGWMYAPD